MPPEVQDQHFRGVRDALASYRTALATLSSEFGGFKIGRADAAVPVDATLDPLGQIGQK
jgi:hypothetical protein